MAPGVLKERLRRDRFFQLGLVLVALVVAAAALAPWLAPFDPLKGDLRNAYLLSPGGSFVLGTDTQGRDVLSRVLYGARISLSVGLISQSVSVTLGVLLGLIAGYYGRWVDAIVMRLADVTLAFPTLLLLIAVAAAVKPSLPVVFLVIGVVGWAGMARLVRSQVLVLKRAVRRRRPGPRCEATGVSCCNTSCRMCGRRSSSRRRSVSRARSWPRPHSRSSASARSHPRRAGEPWSRTAGTCSGSRPGCRLPRDSDRDCRAGLQPRRRRAARGPTSQGCAVTLNRAEPRSPREAVPGPSPSSPARRGRPPGRGVSVGRRDRLPEPRQHRPPARSGPGSRSRRSIAAAPRPFACPTATCSAPWRNGAD